MEITVFAKSRTTTDQNGKPKQFYTYIGKLVRKSTGEVVTVQVKFRQDCGAPDPKTCPRNIEFSKKCANYSEHVIERDDGSQVMSRTLWISEWQDKGEFIDKSLDDFD